MPVVSRWRPSLYNHDEYSKTRLEKILDEGMPMVSARRKDQNRREQE